MGETCGRHVGDMWEPNYNHIRLKVMRCRFKTWPSHCVVFLSKTHSSLTFLRVPLSA